MVQLLQLLYTGFVIFLFLNKKDPEVSERFKTHRKWYLLIQLPFALLYLKYYIEGIL